MCTFIVHVHWFAKHDYVLFRGLGKPIIDFDRWLLQRRRSSCLGCMRTHKRRSHHVWGWLFGGELIHRRQLDWVKQSQPCLALQECLARCQLFLWSHNYGASIFLHE